ncbi:4-hydroxy-tetrahydrodipicolinate synthase [Austwickia sp. TVS 96-490-7B]|uniref:4-hydroxy-tetrahydrodipicolinate synthase n=1 Tax=Austwickia sp. TVS 96-490-7B TaxID=2830843 RepID=UPI001C589D05|nr:4-hydroxy-tetrahydrodipicolinate synthase [Austwickia sp. TVS 96-490-7B]MBW3085307.1 4-hydroxy-tetrahydrodipicolinate synthase [Austwickia sp. TVS 96-490-7B]
MTQTPTALPARPFGSVLTAMVTPMTPDGAIDVESVRSLVEHLLATGHDGIVVNGTTGESATLSDEESIEMMRLVTQTVAGRAAVVAGVGSNDTRHVLEMSAAAAQVGVDGLLLVSPYYNKPTQRGLIAHCHAVADATELPIMLYDIPGRTGIPFTTATLLALAEHPRIVAVKDAKGDQWAATTVVARTDLAWYSGIDEDNLAMLALGASGVVSVVGHLAGQRYRAMVDAVDRGDLAEARRIHRELQPAVDAIMTTSQGAITAKAMLAEAGIIAHPTVRLPLVTSTEAELQILREGLAASGLAAQGVSV